jgi:hypothetical protein
MMLKHAPHVCWHCSYLIFSDEPEKQVKGLPKANIRYAHATEEACHKAVNRYPYPERYGRDPATDAEDMWNGKEN